MFQRLLVAVDGSPASLKAADMAIKLAARLSARLDVLSVEETAPHYVATSEENAREQSAAFTYYTGLQVPLAKQARQSGVQTQCAVVSGHEGQAILDYVKEYECDLLIIGYQGHSGVWGAFLGSTADKLVNHTSRSILVVRADMGKTLYKRLLIALDGSPLSTQALSVGLQMAKTLGASLHVISVVEGPRTPPASSLSPVSSAGRNTLHWDWEAYLRRTQILAEAQAAIAGVPIETTIRQGQASSVLIEAARAGGYDLLILGATGQERPWSSTTGGTARKVANEAPCAVLLVKPPIGELRVRDLMSTEVARVAPDTSLAEGMRMLVEQGVKLLVVVNPEQHVIGVITLGSLLAQDEVYRRLDLPQTASPDLFLQHLRQLFTAKNVVSEVMITQPIVVKEDGGIEQAVRWMLSQHVTRMPVVDAAGKLVGLLDQESLLRYYTGDTGRAGTLEASPASANTPAPLAPRTVGEIALTQVPLIAFDAPPTEVLQQIQSTPLRRVIVVKYDGTALGVIADRDLLEARGVMSRRNPLLAFAGRFSLRFPEERFRRRFSSGLLSAQQLMRPRLFSVMPSTPVAEALRLMLAHQIKRLVVVDGDGKPLGLVDRQRLLRVLVEGETPPA